MKRLDYLKDLYDALEEDDPLQPYRKPIGWDLIETALHDDDVHWSNFIGAYDGSLTDAVALAEGMLPGVDWNVWTAYPIGKEYACRVKMPGCPEPKLNALGYAPTPARAMLLAVLEALIDGEENK